MLGVCSICGATFSQINFDVERFSKSIGITADHHSSIASFIQSAETGCYLCSQAFYTFRSQDCALMRELVASLWKPERSANRHVHDDYSSVKRDGGLFFTRLYLKVNADNDFLTIHYIFYKKYKEGLQEQGLFEDRVQSCWAALEPQLPMGNFNFSYIFGPKESESDQPNLETGRSYQSSKTENMFNLKSTFRFGLRYQ